MEVKFYAKHTRFFDIGKRVVRIVGARELNFASKLLLTGKDKIACSDIV
ncbi:MAG TPA: hypothetical protein VMT42_04145 [candidate division Zixibacteria bacterium]|nr:hypothetical protein [candidate division Zixibacteria bacterium]